MENLSPREILAHRFNLPYEPVMQDWELEVSDIKRVTEFLDAYDEFDEPYVKETLMELILFSYEHHGHDLFIEKRIREILLRDWELHSGTVRYWSLIDHELSDELPEEDQMFPITPFMRTMWHEKQNLAS